MIFSLFIVIQRETFNTTLSISSVCNVAGCLFSGIGATNGIFCSQSSASLYLTDSSFMSCALTSSMIYTPIIYLCSINRVCVWNCSYGAVYFIYDNNYFPNTGVVSMVSCVDSESYGHLGLARTSGHYEMHEVNASRITFKDGFSIGPDIGPHKGYASMKFIEISNSGHNNIFISYGEGTYYCSHASIVNNSAGGYSLVSGYYCPNWLYGYVKFSDSFIINNGDMKLGYGSIDSSTAVQPEFYVSYCDVPTREFTTMAEHSPLSLILRCLLLKLIVYS